MTRKLSGRMQKMDWQRVIFEDTGTKVATHCKIWKSAISRMEESQSDSISILSTISSRSIESRDESSKNEKSFSDYFFEEEEIETGKSSEKISTSRDHEVQLAQHTAEVLLYMLLPEEELKSRIVVRILVEIVTNAIILPFIDMAVSADYLNQMTCWWFEDLCSDVEELTLSLSNCVKDSFNIKELNAFKSLAELEASKLRANDVAGAESEAKLELIFLEEQIRLVTEKLKKIKKGEVLSTTDSNSTNGSKDNLYDLSIEIVLGNKTALEAFKQYLQSCGQEKYLFFWLHVENFRVSAEKLSKDYQERPQVNKLSDFLSGKSGSVESHKISTLRAIACSIYEEYLSTSAPSRLQLDERLVANLKHDLRYDS